jgi:hypothetical protein
MKHILNNLSNEEKNSIREQHTGGMNVVTENFNRLLGSKLGDSKPLVETEELPEGMFSRELSKTDKLKRDINDAISRKIASPKTTGVSGKWSYGEEEKSMEQILNDIEDVVSRYRGEESESFVSEQVLPGLSSGNSQQGVKMVFDSCKNIPAKIDNNSNAIADNIYKAIQGIGTDENAIMKAFSTIPTLNAFCSVYHSYGKTYGKHLFSDLDGDIDEESVWAGISRILRNLKQAPVAKPTQGGVPQKPMGGAKPTTGGVTQKPMGGAKPTNTQGTVKDPKMIRQQMMSKNQTRPTTVANPNQVRR